MSSLNLQENINNKIDMYKTAYAQLQHNFKNNVNVITELQEENQKLIDQLDQMKMKHLDQIEQAVQKQRNKYVQEIQSMENTYFREIELIKKEYEDYINGLEGGKEKERAQLMASISKKNQKQQKLMRQSFEKQLKSMDEKISYHSRREKILTEGKDQLSKKLNQAEIQNVQLKAKLQQIIKSKVQFQSISRNYQDELQSIKNSKSQWEDMLKQKVKQIQKQKNKLEEQLTQQNYMAKDKMRRAKQDFNKKILKLEQDHSVRLRQLLRQSKQIKLKYDTMKSEDNSLKGQIQSLKKQIQSLKKQAEKKQADISQISNLHDTVKTMQCNVKITQAQKVRLQNLSDQRLQQLKGIKQELQAQSERRQTAEKALERVKTQLLNKIKEAEQISSLNKKLKYQIEVNSYQNGRPTTINTMNKNLQKYQQRDAIKGQVQYSQCFTQDLGPIDQKAFLAQSKAIGSSPKNNKFLNYYNTNNQDDMQSGNFRVQQSDLMKRIGELQNFNEELKQTIKVMKTQMQRTSIMFDEKNSLKDRQIKLCKDQNFILRERINDKDSQIISLNQVLKSNKQELQSFKQKSSQQVDVGRLNEQNSKLKDQVVNLNQKISQLKEEIQDLKGQRDTLQQISGDLKADLDLCQDRIDYLEGLIRKNDRSVGVVVGGNKINSKVNNQNPSTSEFKKQNRQNSKNNNNHHYHQIQSQKRSHNQFNNKNNNNNKPESQKLVVPVKNAGHQGVVQKKKLHELIRERKQMQSGSMISGVSGRKARIQERNNQERIQHTGTHSQKRAFEKIESRSKSRESHLKQRQNRIRLSNNQLLTSSIRAQKGQNPMNPIGGQSVISNIEEPQNDVANNNQSGSQLQNVSMGFWNS